MDDIFNIEVCKNYLINYYRYDSYYNFDLTEEPGYVRKKSVS